MEKNFERLDAGLFGVVSDEESAHLVGGTYPTGSWKVTSKATFNQNGADAQVDGEIDG